MKRMRNTTSYQCGRITSDANKRTKHGRYVQVQKPGSRMQEGISQHTALQEVVRMESGSGSRANSKAKGKARTVAERGITMKRKEFITNALFLLFMAVGAYIGVWVLYLLVK